MLPDDFQFSQASLQDFVDCSRRFYLRYVERVRWPAVEAEPVLEHERRMQAGRRFHRMVQQQILGIPIARLSDMVADEDLERWWAHYLDARPADAAGDHYPELTLSAPLAGYRLAAKYDLVVIAPDGAGLIFDWKTSRTRTQRRWLVERLQTRVYRYLLARAGGHLLAPPEPSLPPDRVQMVYWFAEHPDDPERLSYDATQYAADEEELVRLITEIRAREGPEDFPRTDDARRCRYCPYRSLCDRGQAAGPLAELDADFEPEREPRGVDVFDLDFDQVAEVEF
jgi:hypothetical protein